MTRSLVRLAAGTPSFLTVESPILPVLRPWAIRQLTVEGAIRGRIYQYRHGFSYARSRTMMDETLIATFRVARLTLETRKLWCRDRP